MKKGGEPPKKGEVAVQGGGEGLGRKGGNCGCPQRWNCRWGSSDSVQEGQTLTREELLSGGAAHKTSEGGWTKKTRPNSRKKPRKKSRKNIEGERKVSF